MPAEEQPGPDPRAPRSNPRLVGHQAAEMALLQAASAGRLPHAFLFSGAYGIGKATLAYRFTRWLLASAGPSEEPGLFGSARPASLAIDPDHPAARRVASGGHADLLTVERTWDPKRRRLRSEILAEDARAIADFFHLTPAEGGWRIAVVDGAEEMNRFAANAILKILEEPPRRSLLILVSHAAGRLLPTIRSRCRLLNLQPLAEDEVAALLSEHRPDLSGPDAAVLARLGEGSIGRSLALADAGGVQLYRALIDLLGGLPRLDRLALHRLADQVSRGESDAYDALTQMLRDLVVRLVTARAEGRPQEIGSGEAALVRRLGEGGRLDRWVELWEKLNELFGRADALNLDRKQVLIDAFLTVEREARSA